MARNKASGLTLNDEFDGSPFLYLLILISVVYTLPWQLWNDPLLTIYRNFSKHSNTKGFPVIDSVSGYFSNVRKHGKVMRRKYFRIYMIRSKENAEAEAARRKAAAEAEARWWNSLSREEQTEYLRHQELVNLQKQQIRSQEALRYDMNRQSNRTAAEIRALREQEAWNHRRRI